MEVVRKVLYHVMKVVSERRFKCCWCGQMVVINPKLQWKGIVVQFQLKGKQQRMLGIQRTSFVGHIACIIPLNYAGICENLVSETNSHLRKIRYTYWATNPKDRFRRRSDSSKENKTLNRLSDLTHDRQNWRSIVKRVVQCKLWRHSNKYFHLHLHLHGDIICHCFTDLLIFRCSLPSLPCW